MNRSQRQGTGALHFFVFGLMETVLNDRFCTKNHSLHRPLHMVNRREMNRIILLHWYSILTLNSHLLFRLYKMLHNLGSINMIHHPCVYHCIQRTCAEIVCTH